MKKLNLSVVGVLDVEPPELVAPEFVPPVGVELLAAPPEGVELLAIPPLLRGKLVAAPPAAVSPPFEAIAGWPPIVPIPF